MGKSVNARALVAAIILVFSIGHGERARAGDDEAGPAVPPGEMRVHVKTAVAVEGDLTVVVHALATVMARPDAAAAVVAHVAGFVTKVEVADGDAVEAGAPLVRIDQRPFIEALDKVKAAINSAKGDLERAKSYTLDADQVEFERAAIEARALVAPTQKESERQAALAKDGLATEKAATDARIAAEAAVRVAAAAEQKVRVFHEKGRAAEITRLESALAQAETDLAPAERALAATVVAAPVKGRVSGLSVVGGQSVDAGTILAQVTGVDASALRLGLAPADAEAIAIGAPATVPGRGFSGTVKSVGGAVDVDTGLVPVIVRLDACSASPRIGETLLVEVERGKPVHGILVPSAALEIRDDVPRIVVVDASLLTHAVTVTLLARGSDRVAVTGEGLVAGARVAVDGNFNLPDGARVVVDEGEKASPEAPSAMSDGK